MANEKVLVLEAWADSIVDTRAVRDFYASAERLLSTSKEEPVRFIGRPLLSASYQRTIAEFLELECNQRGPNLIIFSAHGSHQVLERNGKSINTRTLSGHDAELNISTGIRSLSNQLARSIIIFDSCEVGQNIASFRAASNALCVIGFSTEVDWIDSSIFVLALLLRLQDSGVLHHQRAERKSRHRTPTLQKVLESMNSDQYEFLAKSLGFQFSIAKST